MQICRQINRCMQFLWHFVTVLLPVHMQNSFINLQTQILRLSNDKVFNLLKHNHVQIENDHLLNLLKKTNFGKIRFKSYSKVLLKSQLANFPEMHFKVDSNLIKNQNKRRQFVCLYSFIIKNFPIFLFFCNQPIFFCCSFKMKFLHHTQ